MTEFHNTIIKTASAPSPTLWVDTDNALGSFSGDVDDAFAIYCLIKSQFNIANISSTFGNTTSAKSYQNTKKLLSVLDRGEIQVLMGAHKPVASPNRKTLSDATKALLKHKGPTTYLALGPLTNLAEALLTDPDCANQIDHLIYLGTNFPKKLPTNRFFDFNTIHDLEAVRLTLQSKIRRITIVPCYLARKLRLELADLHSITNEDEKTYLIKNSRRWFLRAQLLKFTNNIPAWDVMTVRYLKFPEEFTSQKAIYDPKLGLLPCQSTTERSNISVLTDWKPNSS